MGIKYAKLLARTAIMAGLVGVDLYMFRTLIGGLMNGELEPAVSAILSGLAASVTGAIALAAKDFFGVGKD